MLVLFFLSMVLYFTNVSEGSVVRARLEATELCLEAASTLGSFAALGGNSSYTLALPEGEGQENYTIWVNSGEKKVKVDYGTGGVACDLHIGNITNSTGGTLFRLEKNASLRNENGVVRVG